MGRHNTDRHRDVGVQTHAFTHAQQAQTCRFHASWHEERVEVLLEPAEHLQQRTQPDSHITTTRQLVMPCRPPSLPPSLTHIRPSMTNIKR